MRAKRAVPENTSNYLEIKRFCFSRKTVGMHHLFAKSLDKRWFYFLKELINHVNQHDRQYANKGSYASKVCITGIAALGLALCGCHSGPEPSATPQHHSVRLNGRAFDVFVSPSGVGAKRPCAWYGARDEGLLYFGEAAFWNALRETGEPTADLESRGPQRVGRFQLSPTPRMLAPIQVATDRPSGVWDVFPHPNGRVYFTTFFASAGYVELKDNRVKRFPALGTGLNEWAAGPRDSLFVTRYAADSGARGGSLLWMDPEGNSLGEIPLHASSKETQIAPKTVAWDPQREELWVTTDVIPQRTGPQAHPTLVLNLDGQERLRIHDFEIQFVRFGSDGTGYLALTDNGALFLGILEPPPAAADPATIQRIVLDPHFASDYDFAQGLEFAEDGRIIVTTWSGGIYVVNPEGNPTVQSLAFPRLDEDGLYYTAVLAESHLCATYCSDLAVVCTELD